MVIRSSRVQPVTNLDPLIDVLLGDCKLILRIVVYTFGVTAFLSIRVSSHKSDISKVFDHFDMLMYCFCIIGLWMRLQYPEGIWRGHSMVSWGAKGSIQKTEKLKGVTLHRNIFTLFAS